MTSGAPETYAEWLPLLDRFRDGDDSVMELLQRGSIDWTAIVAERWTKQLTSCLITRLQQVNRTLQRDLDRSRGDSFGVSHALLAARRALVPLRQLGAMPSLPPQLADHLQAEIARFAAERQATLERSAAAIRSDGGRLLKVLRDTPLTAAPEPPPRPALELDEPATGAARRRRILL